jgi:Rrf2 family protein
MMSKKCKYAIKALVRLANNYGKGNLLTADIAEQAGIPKKFLEQILLELKHAGYVGSKMGAHGGYYLKTEPQKVTVADIYRLFDGAIALVPCVTYKFYEKCDDCESEKKCTFRREFMKIRDQTRDIMKKTTLKSFM